MNAARVGSPWRRDLQAKPLLSWRGSQLQAIEAALAAACAPWAAAWGLDPASLPTPCCTPATRNDVQREAWRLLGQSPEAVALYDSEDAAAALSMQLFGQAALVGPLASEVLQACLHDLLARLAAALELAGAADGWSTPTAAFSAWSGWVHVRLPSGLRLLLDAGAVRALLRQQGTPEARPATRPVEPPLVPLADALAARVFALQVHLQGCELEIGSLRELQVGDVLRLQHRLDAPAAVQGVGGRALFHGFLARSRGRKAVELAPAH